MASYLGMEFGLSSAKRHDGERRQSYRNTMLPIVAWDRARRDQAAVAEVRSAEQLRIRIEDLLVEALLRHTELVPGPRHRGEVAAEQQEVLRVFGAPQE